MMFDFLSDFGEILDLFSTAASAYSTYQAGKEAKRVDDSAAVVAQANAADDKARAADVRSRGVQEADQADQRQRRLIGSQKAAMGASGVVAGEGTFANLLADTESQGQQDEATIMHNALTEAWGYDRRAEDETRKASELRRAGSAAATNGTIKGLGSLVAGTYDLGTKYKWW
jgi:hypothetical protein